MHSLTLNTNICTLYQLETGRNETATETAILVSTENETALSVSTENEIECTHLNL